MNLQSEDRQTMVRGRFNPHIVNPDWLKSEKIWEPDQVQLHLGAIFEGLNFGTAAMETEWLVDGRALVVKSRKEDCGELAAQVIEKLPHTPISAVGNNFTYAVPASESSGELPRIESRMKEAFGEDFPLSELTWQGVVPLEDEGSNRVVIAVTHTSEGVLVIRFNFHRKVKDTEGAVKAARKFKDDESRSIEFARLVLTKTIGL